MNEREQYEAWVGGPEPDGLSSEEAVFRHALWCFGRDAWQARADQAAALTKRIVALLAELEESGVLSEQQCAKYLGIDLLKWRLAKEPK